VKNKNSNGIKIDLFCSDNTKATEKKFLYHDLYNELVVIKYKNICYEKAIKTSTLSRHQQK
jgi:hypothetical protein